MNEKKQATASDKLLNLVLGVVILVIFAVGVYATYGKIAANVKDKAIESGEKEATVEYLARKADLTIEDYLAQYGLELNDTITADTTESNMMDNMTLENYLKYNGGEQTAEEVLEGTGLSDKATKDTLWKDFLPMAPAISIIGNQDTFNQMKSVYGFENDDISWGELQELINAKQEADNANSSDTAENADNADAANNADAAQAE